MVRVLFITGDQSQTGGTERACADVANMLFSEGFEVSILSLSGPLKSHFKISENIQLHSFGLDDVHGARLMARATLGIHSFLSKHYFDIVINVESILFLFMSLRFLNPMRNEKIVNWEHFNYDVDLGVRLRKVARWLASHFADLNVVLTHSDRDKWLKNFRVKPEKIKQVYNINSFESYVTDSLHGIKNSKTIVAAGRLTDQKGFDLLIEAWNKIPESSINGWRLFIYGEGEDRNALEALVTGYYLKASVFLPGRADNMVELYSNADLFVLSSRYEGFGLVLTEALSCGTPVIAFDCPNGPSEIVMDGINGLLVPCTDTQGLANTIEKFITSDELRLNLTFSAHEGLERFSSKMISIEWLSLVENLIKDSK